MARGYLGNHFPAKVALKFFAAGDQRLVRLSDFATIISVAALGYTGGVLALTLVGSHETVGTVGQITRLGSVDPVPPLAQLEEVWPPVFGVLAAVEPVVEKISAETETLIEPAPVVPVIWPDYSLRGLVTMGPRKWAFVISDLGESLVSIGDTLGNGEKVAEISAEGVWLEKQGERTFVGFKENGTVSIIKLPPLETTKDNGGPQASVEEIRIQDLDEEGLRKLLEKIRSRPSLRRPAPQ